MSTRAVFTPPFVIGFANGDDWEPAVEADAFGNVDLQVKAIAAGTVFASYLDGKDTVMQRSDDFAETSSAATAVADSPNKRSSRSETRHHDNSRGISRYHDSGARRAFESRHAVGMKQM